MSTAIARRRKNGAPKLEWGNPGIYFLAAVVIVAILAPVAYVIIGGFRTNSQITDNPAGLPNPWVVENYTEVIASPIFWRQILNSTIAATATTVGVVILGMMASFVIARYPFKGREAMYSLFAAGLMFPMTVAITPDRKSVV